MVTTAGVIMSTAYFLPYGGYRYPSTPPPSELTDTGFTGHKHNDSVGLIYMQARFYVPSIGRFAIADSIVPGPTNPQAFNRYSYVLGNPIRYTDPSGHCAQDDSECWEIADQLYSQYGWTIEGIWSLEQVKTMLEGAQLLEAWIESILFEQGLPQNVNARGVMRTLFGGATIAHPSDFSGFRLMDEGNGYHHVWGTTVYMLDEFTSGQLIHEMFHIADNKFGFDELGGSAAWGGGPADDMVQTVGQDISDCFYRSRCSGYGYTPGAEPPPGSPGSYAWEGPSEDFAQTGRYSALNPSLVGSRRTEWMNNFVALQTATPEFTVSPYTFWQRHYEPKYQHLGSGFFTEE